MAQEKFMMKRSDSILICSTVASLASAAKDRLGLVQPAECLDDGQTKEGFSYEEDHPEFGDIPVLVALYDEIVRMTQSLSGSPPSLEHCLRRCHSTQERLLNLLSDLGYVNPTTQNQWFQHLQCKVRRYFKRDQLKEAHVAYREAVLLLRNIIMGTLTHQRLEKFPPGLLDEDASDPFAGTVTVFKKVNDNDIEQKRVPARLRYDTACDVELVSSDFLIREEFGAIMREPLEELETIEVPGQHTLTLREKITLTWTDKAESRHITTVFRVVDSGGFDLILGRHFIRENKLLWQSPIARPAKKEGNKFFLVMPGAGRKRADTAAKAIAFDQTRAEIAAKRKREFEEKKQKRRRTTRRDSIHEHLVNPAGPLSLDNTVASGIPRCESPDSMMRDDQREKEVVANLPHSNRD